MTNQHTPWYLVFAALLFFPLACHAADELLTIPDGTYKFGDVGISGVTHAMTFGAAVPLPTNQGRISNQVDRGAGAHSVDYRWTCSLSLQGTLTGLKGLGLEVWAARSNGTIVDGSLPTTDGALTDATGDRNNLMPIGHVFLDHETTNQAHIGSGTVEIPFRYWSLVVWNTSTQSFSTVGNSPSYCEFTSYSKKVN